MARVYGPMELVKIGADPHAFFKVGKDEYHGPCPLCNAGEDRFVVYTDRPWPHWNFFCRVCHPENGWIDELNPCLKEQLSPEERRRWAEEHARQVEINLEKQIAKAQSALAELRSARSWERYHEQLTEEARVTWSGWGIPDFFQDFWKLGFDPDRTVWTGNVEWHTPTMTIPIFEPLTWDVLNVRHRLMKPPKPGDKYRPERSGLPSALFVADPDMPLDGMTLVVEGEKKSMVTYITADNPRLRVVGIPGKNPKPEMLNALKDCEPVYICLDPDAANESVAIAQTLGADRCRVIDLPDKIDDLILRYHLDKDWMRGLFGTARKVRA
jgi:hypothetical protein